jgi:hypothetical protein
MTSDFVKDIETQLKVAKGIVEFHQSLERLADSKDFKKVILDGYFKDEAIRLVHLKADPAMQSADTQKSLLAQMDSIGALSSYFRSVRLKAEMAAKTIASNEDALAEIAAEELNNV